MNKVGYWNWNYKNRRVNRLKILISTKNLAGFTYHLASLLRCAEVQDGGKGCQ